MRYWMSVLVLLVSIGTAQAELYVAAQGGGAFPSDFANVKWSAGGQSVSGSDFRLNNSGLYGGKVGYYFDQLRWLGVETDVHRSTPNLPMQPVSIGGVPLGTLSMIDHSLITWSPLVVLVRAPLGTLPAPIEPYAGVGFGVFFSSLSSPQSSFSSSSTSVGFVAQAGIRYRVTPNWSGFVEWKL